MIDIRLEEGRERLRVKLDPFPVNGKEGLIIDNTVFRWKLSDGPVATFVSDTLLQIAEEDLGFFAIIENDEPKIVLAIDMSNIDNTGL